MGKKYNLTNPQKSIWYTEQFYANSPIDNVSGTLLIEEIVNFELLEKALNLFIEKNDMVRCHMELKDGNPVQSILPYHYQKLTTYYVSSKEELSALQETFVNVPIDLFSPKLFHIRMLKLPDGTGGFHVVFHHLIADAWSMSLLINEVTDYYAKLKEGNITSFDSHPSYCDYIETENKYMNSEKFEKDKDYWNSVFSTSPNLTSFSSKKIIAKSQIANRKAFAIENSDAIVLFCKENGITPYTFFMAIYAIYLYRTTGSNDIIFGTPVLNRSNIREKNCFGMFINTLPIRISVQENGDFLSLAKSISEQQFSLFRHHKYPYINLLSDLRNKYHLTENLYDTLFSYQNARDNSNHSSVPYSTHWDFNGYTANSLDLHFYDMDNSGILHLYYDYQVEKFTESEIYHIHNRIMYMIQQLLEQPSLTVNELEIVTPEERQFLIHDINQTFSDYEKDLTVVDLFERQAVLHPNKTAVIFENTSLTYSELNQKANQLAHFLKEKKQVSPHDFIGIMVNRSLEMAVGLLAILKTGAAYIPIDPEYPEERVTYMLEDSKAVTILVDEKTKSLPFISQGTNISLSEPLYKEEPTTPITSCIEPSSIMYLIYTSGSTGKPKGVMLTHQNICNYIHGLTQVIPFYSDKVMVSVTTICFDIFVTELWASLLRGIVVVIANEQQQNIASELNALCNCYHVNMIQTTPSRFKLLLSEGDYEFLENITDLLVGGESLPPDLLEKLKQYPTLTVYNMYGPTETAVWSTIKVNPSLDAISIGKPIANTQVYLLDDHLKLLPPNIPGKLYIGGDGVSNGYFHRDDLTNKVFIPSPFDKDKIIYNTNDLAYVSEQGELFHLGRADFQVKIHGFRIELGEIESVLLDFPSIKNAVIIHHQNDLNAFIVCEGKVEYKTLMNHLLHYLPHYMIPKNIITIDSIPLTPNGKVDRKNPIFQQIPTTSSVQEKVKPRTEQEKLLASIISKEVGESVGITDNFFELGMDSLAIIKVISKLCSHHMNLSVQDFYNYPTIEILASHVGSKHGSLLTPKKTEFLTSLSSIQSPIEKTLLPENSGILLTGVTGFLGIHVLADLLKNTNHVIYCLIRSKDEKDGIERLKDRLDYYFPQEFNQFLNTRVFVIDSDIKEKHFKLSEEEYLALGNKVQSVIHCAADVRHFGNYEMSKKINIDATNYMIDFCTEFHAVLNYVSTMTVSGYGLVPVEKQVTFQEDNFYIGQHFEDNIYVRSKFVAENCIYQALERGLIANIYRVGNLTNRYSDAKFQFNSYENAFLNRLRAIKDSKSLPYSLKDLSLELTFVDSCANAIVNLALKKAITQNLSIYHLYNHHFMKVSDLLNLLEKEGFPIELTDEEHFRNSIIAHAKNANELSGFLAEFNPANLIDTSRLFSNKQTQMALNEVSFHWPTISKQYITKMIRGL